MTELAGPPPAGITLPPIFEQVADGDAVTPIWLNLRGDLTARIGSDRYLKWSPTAALGRERERLEWAVGYHPVPRVLASGEDWLLTEAIDGVSAVTVEPAVAAVALGAGLRALHDELPADHCPFDWSASARGAVIPPPSIDRLVVCHGDACVPNTLVREGSWVAHVDLGSLGVADRWADLAVAAWSLDANFGPGWRDSFFAAYGIRPDEERLGYYTALWNRSST